MNDKLRAAHDKLQDAVAEIVSGDDWKRMLQVASKFHRYSTGGISFSSRSTTPMRHWLLVSTSGSRWAAV